MTDAARTEHPTIPSELPAAPGDEALRSRIEDEAEAVLAIRGHDDARAAAVDVAQALVEGLRLHASTVFVNAGDGSRPAERFRSVTGRMDESDSD